MFRIGKRRHTFRLPRPPTTFAHVRQSTRAASRYTHKSVLAKSVHGLALQLRRSAPTRALSPLLPPDCCLQPMEQSSEAHCHGGTLLRQLAQDHRFGLAANGSHRGRCQILALSSREWPWRGTCASGSAAHAQQQYTPVCIGAMVYWTLAQWHGHMVVLRCACE